MQSLPKPKLGDMLVTAGVLTDKNLEWALDQQKSNYKRLGEIILDAGLASEDCVAEARALQMEMPYVELEDLPGLSKVASLIPEAIARTYNVVPLAVSGDRLAIATANPTDVEAIDAVQRFAKKRVEPILAAETKLVQTIERIYGAFESADITASIEQAIEDVETTEADLDTSSDLAEERRQSGQAPVVKTVNLVLQEAVKQRASDIHFEPRARSLEIRYRLDGALHPVRNLPRQIQPAIISRIKIMAEMDIAEKRRPQDGRIAIKVHNKSIDLRISTLPVHYGERVVMRILDKNGQLFAVDNLGFAETELEQFKKLLGKPYGIILVTGPTGSGKTTTLYAALSHIRSPETNIITCEDPIEYELEGVNQSAVNVRAGLTFATQLRAILRQDPDVILVGEIRDSETATIAFQAAMTGHLVFSTLHCNDAASAITRLVDMGVEPFLIGSSIVGVLAQRLVRSLCPKCKEAYQAAPEELLEMGMDPGEPSVELYRAVGCPHCDSRGYNGRLAVYELMTVDESIRRLAIQEPTSDQVRDLALNGGMKTMRQHAIEKVLSGLTTLDEVRKKVLMTDALS